MVLLVVPGEEVMTPLAGIEQRTEAVRIGRRILEGAKVRLRVRIVVGDMRPAVALGDAQITHQEGDRLGRHRCAAVGMDRQLAGLNLLL